MSESEFEEFAQTIRDDYEREVVALGLDEKIDAAALALGRRLVEETIAVLRSQSVVRGTMH